MDLPRDCFCPVHNAAWCRIHCPLPHIVRRFLRAEVSRYEFMKNLSIKHLQEMTALCSEVLSDDGIAPQDLKKQDRRASRSSHRLPSRALQYHKAVRQCLDGAFARICMDPLLVDLVVSAVEPIGKGAKLLVVVETPFENQAHLQIIEAALQGAVGRLRAVVAGEVRRKRTPHLSFRVIPAFAEPHAVE
jgi:ribosome-binding factor A